jgi:murein biosynthesis integral membrane protein MurJ
VDNVFRFTGKSSYSLKVCLSVSNARQVVLRLLQSGLIVSVGIMLGRLSGFARDVMVAGAYGATESADLAVLVLTLPDVIVAILMGGGLSAAFIPEFRRLEGRARCGLFLKGSLMVGVGFTMAAGVLAFFSQEIMLVAAPGLAEQAAVTGGQVLEIALWVIPFTTLAGLSAAYLQANDQFAVASLGTLIFNLTVISGLAWIFLHGGDLLMLGWFIVLGGILRWLSQVGQIKGVALAVRSAWSVKIGGAVATRYIQALSGGAALILIPVIARAFASLAEPGSIAVVSYAWKLVEFPLGVGVTVIAVVLFPYISGCFSDENRRDEGLVAVRAGVLVVTLLGLSIAIPMVLFSRDFADLAFGWGAMSDDAIRQIGVLMAIGLISLPVQGVSSLLIAVFNARRDTRTPMLINLLGVFLFAGLALIAQLLGAGIEGVMVSMTLTYITIFIFQIVWLNRRHDISLGKVLMRGNVVAAVVAVACVTLILSRLILDQNYSSPVNVVAAIVCGVTLLSVGLLASRESRQFIKGLISR